MPSLSDELTLIGKLVSHYPGTALMRRAFQLTFPIEANFLSGENIEAGEMAKAIADICINLSLDHARLFASEGHSSVENRIIPQSDGFLRIRGNEEFFEACAEQLTCSETVRLTVVGPTFLEPDWWIARSKAANIGRLDFTEVLKKRLLGDPALRKSEIILRNNFDRYRSNLQEYVRNDREWRKLITEMRSCLRKLFGNAGERGPRIRCFDPGFSHLPHIFDDTVLIATRSSPLQKVNGGWKVDLPIQVASELEKWIAIFHGSNQTQQDALRELGEFLDRLENGC